MPQNNRLSIERTRASIAFKYAQDGANITAYGSNVNKMSMYIKANGLGNTIAFIYSKAYVSNNAAWKKIYDQIATWLNTAEHSLVKNRLERNEDLIKTVLGLSQEEYRFATREVLALLNWWRRFVKDDTEQNTQQQVNDGV